MDKYHSYTLFLLVWHDFTIIFNSGWHWPRQMSKFFRFLSRRRTGRGVKRTEIGHPKKKNVVPCIVMLLDGTDFSIDLPVSYASYLVELNNIRLVCIWLFEISAIIQLTFKSLFGNLVSHLTWESVTLELLTSNNNHFHCGVGYFLLWGQHFSGTFVIMVHVHVSGPFAPNILLHPTRLHLTCSRPISICIRNSKDLYSKTCYTNPWKYGGRISVEL